jgi:hypothetical protein
MNKAAQIQWLPLAGKKRKLKRLNARDRLDKLIDWYEKNMPDHEKVLPGGCVIETDQLNKWAKEVSDNEWLYRGWTLKRAEPPVVKKTKIRK